MESWYFAHTPRSIARIWRFFLRNYAYLEKYNVTHLQTVKSNGINFIKSEESININFLLRSIRRRCCVLLLVVEQFRGNMLPHSSGYKWDVVPRVVIAQAANTGCATAESLSGLQTRLWRTMKCASPASFGAWSLQRTGAGRTDTANRNFSIGLTADFGQWISVAH